MRNKKTITSKNGFPDSLLTFETANSDRILTEIKNPNSSKAK